MRMALKPGSDPSSRIGTVIEVWPASAAVPGQGAAARLTVQWAAQASAMKSYARISAPEIKAGAGVTVLVSVGRAVRVGVLVGAWITVTCTQISPVELLPSPKRWPL